MRFKDCILINERTVELDGKSFKSEKEAGFYLGSIGKSPEEIVKLLGTTLPMAKWYARAGAKAGGVIPEPKKKDKPEPTPIAKPIVNKPIPSPIVDKPKPFVSSSSKVDIKGRNGDISIPLKMKPGIAEYEYASSEQLNAKYSMRKDGMIDSFDKNLTAAVGVINGKLICRPEDVPNFVDKANYDSHSVAQKIASNKIHEVDESLKHLPQELLNVIHNSPTFARGKVSIKNSAVKGGGWCKPSQYEIFWGMRNPNPAYVSQVLRHELMHMFEGYQYKLTSKVSQRVLDCDYGRMRKPSTAVDLYVDDIVKKVDQGLYRIEAEKILKEYDLTFEDLAEIVKFDKQDKINFYGENAFRFALYLSQGELTNAMKALYKVQVVGYDGKPQWMSMIACNEPVYNCMSDFIGSITKNKVLGKNLGGYGHPTSYYNKRAGDKSTNCELIACYGALMGYECSPRIKKLMKAFAPYTVNAIEALIKTQAYFNSKGDTNDYI